jgi:hypothetical protein
LRSSRAVSCSLPLATTHALRHAARKPQIIPCRARRAAKKAACCPMHSDRDRLHAPLRPLVLCLVCTCRLVRGVDTGQASLHNAT